MVLSHLDIFFNVALAGNVDTIQELSDILVADTGSLLNVSSRLGNIFDRDAGKNKFVLLVGRDFEIDTRSDVDFTDELFTQEISDFDSLAIVDNVNVDGEMGIDVSHLVLVTLGDTSDHVGNKGLDSSKSSNVLSVTVVDSDLDFTFFGL